ncbi:hypothetical protein ABZ612_09385 [Streptomyces avermitilis]|uniref:hypothetical protein n=1 Tax=Streptomyces avermitilis TaxID=33903 RepID=UPI003406FA90
MQTTQEEPVTLPLVLAAEPVPTSGCDVCLALGRQREIARTAGDLSKVSDINVEIKRHRH